MSCPLRQDYLDTHPGSERSPWSVIRSWTIHDNHFDLLHLAYLGFVKERWQLSSPKRRRCPDGRGREGVRWGGNEK